MGTTIFDVAAMAGVSIATISNVINGTRSVRPETRQRVLAAIENLGFVPDSSARHFKGKAHISVGFIVPDISNTFFASLIGTIEELLDDNGHSLIVANTHENPLREASRIRALCSAGVDALIISSSFEYYSDLAQCLPTDIPVVLLDRAPTGCPLDTITADPSGAIIAGMGQLSAKGHKKVGFIGWKPELSTTRQRARAFQEGAKEYDLIPCIRYADFEMDSVSAVESMLSEGCSALLIGNSELCFGLASLARSRQAVPEILSFCDSQKFEQVFAGTSMICQPTEEMGRAAGMRILSRLQNPGLPYRQTILGCSYLDGFSLE